MLTLLTGVRVVFLPIAAPVAMLLLCGDQASVVQTSLATLRAPGAGRCSSACWRRASGSLQPQRSARGT